MYCDLLHQEVKTHPLAKTLVLCPKGGKRNVADHWFPMRYVKLIACVNP